MPQFDPTYFLAQIFWFFVCFGTLWVFIQFYAWPNYKKIQMSRKKNLDVLYTEIKACQEKVRDLKCTNEERLIQAKKDVSLLIEKASMESRLQFEVYRKELLADFQNRIENLRLEIDLKQHEEVKNPFDSLVPHLSDLCLEKFLRPPQQDNSL